MPGTRHYYFLDSIGQGDWFSYGTTLQDVRYAVEGYGAFEGEATDAQLPEKVVLHFPACQGGDVVEGYAIYNYIRSLATRGVKTEARVEGLCASIAVLDALACDEVLMGDAALWMVHKPSSDGWNLNADDMRAAADLLDKIQAQLVGRYVARTGMAAELANELINKESWLNADECLAYGFITGKLPEAPIEAPAGAEKVLNYYKPKTAPAMAITPAEETRLVDKFINAARSFFAPKNEEPAPEPVATNASSDIDGGDTMYYDGTLQADTAVYSDAELTAAYPDGTYTTAEGQNVTVADGIATEVGAATDAAPEPAANNSADLDAATAKITELENQLATANRTVTGLKNKLAKVVPGSTGNPTPPGAAQQSAPKNTAGAKPAGTAFTIRKN